MPVPAGGREGGRSWQIGAGTCSSGDSHEYAGPEPTLSRKLKQSKALWLTIE